MKTLVFTYGETGIHFSVNPLDKNVMVNATEMAKIFDKRTSNYLANDATKEFIFELKRTGIPVDLADNQSDIPVQIIDDRGRNGIYFDRRLALDFAAWLDVRFRVWVFSTIDDIIFGNYKKHWDAHAKQESAKEVMRSLRIKLLTDATTEAAQKYFAAEAEYKAAKNAKSNAIRTQLRLFGNKSDDYDA